MAQAPLADDEFAALMAPLGPFPARPRLAAGVSGGPDSLALALLLDRWCRTRDGALLALTVDHGLRPGSAAEARQVGRLLQARGIAHRRLVWRGEKPAGPVQAAAREARYALLAAACRDAGLLHLAMAHQRQDQAETFLLRLAAGSGLDGLAAMPAVAALPEVLLLRPLLDVPRARLAATVAAAGLAWLEDPSNADPRHRRVALRCALPALAAAGLGVEEAAAAAGAFGRLRRAVAPLLADLLAAAVAWHPAGHAELDAAPLLAAPPALARRALAELLRPVGGAAWPPGEAALERLRRRLAEPARGTTLAGCRLLPRRSGWLVVREEAGPVPQPLPPGARLVWDRRFAVSLGRIAPDGLVLRPLGRRGWDVLSYGPAPLPGPALWPLPALYDAAGPLAVPALGWRRPGTLSVPLRLQLRPLPPAGPAGFTVA